MDNQTACAVAEASERTAEWKANFICANDDLHEAMLSSPWAIIVYAFAVLFIMFLVQRASAPAKTKQADTKKADHH